MYSFGKATIVLPVKITINTLTKQMCAHLSAKKKHSDAKRKYSIRHTGENIKAFWL